MQGMLRFFIGFMIVFGVVGTLEVDPDANLIIEMFIAVVALAIMASGIVANKQQQNG